MELASVVVDECVLTARVVFVTGEPLRTSEVPGLAVAAVAALPGLRGHRCDNDAGLTFADEMADTELAHLVEHATLELMAMSGAPTSLRGRTSWDFASDGRGVFRLRIEFEHEALVRDALATACELVRALAHGDAAPDTEAWARRQRGW